MRGWIIDILKFLLGNGMYIFHKGILTVPVKNEPLIFEPVNIFICLYLFNQLIFEEIKYSWEACGAFFGDHWE